MVFGIGIFFFISHRVAVGRSVVVCQEKFSVCNFVFVETHSGRALVSTVNEANVFFCCLLNDLLGKWLECENAQVRMR